MALDYAKLRKGREAIEKRVAEQQSGGGGNFKPFTPSIYWNEDGMEKYVMFLNPLEEILELELINFIPIRNKKANGDTYTTYEQVLARTDPLLGEREDPMVENWDGKPKVTNLAVAVELEPQYQEVNGRKRPVGFEVKTTSFDRRVRDDKGDITDEVEEVVAPVVGFITQSPANFGNVLTSMDSDSAPIHEVAYSIKRVGKKADTTYNMRDWADQEVDLSALLDCLDGVSYLQDEIDDIYKDIEDLDDHEAALHVGHVMLYKRLEELADSERYEEIYEGITESLDKFGKNKKKSAEPTRRERPVRASQRRRQPEGEIDTPESVNDDVHNEPEEKPARSRRQRAKASQEPAAEVAGPEEKPARRSRGVAKPEGTRSSKLEELKAKAAAKTAAASA
ncbi:MAG: hypothetical protein NVSMB52_10860 [Chloroflexota bacterium]